MVVMTAVCRPQPLVIRRRTPVLSILFPVLHGEKAKLSLFAAPV